jgi:hypothetical protein
MKVVALAGRAGVGKNTIADRYLRPLGYLDVSLAEDIKIRAIATGVASYEEVFLGPKPVAIRTWLQQEGTERGRHVHGEDVWARALFARIRRIEESWGFDKFVITDVRFINEIRFIRDHGGLVYRVDAPQRHVANNMTSEQRAHESETNIDMCPLSLFNGVIYNDPGYADTLQWQVDAHLYLAGHLGRKPSVLAVTTSEKVSLLRKMLPVGVDRAAR